MTPPSSPTHGGARAGAGRKRDAANVKDPAHTRRPVLVSQHPLHVMLMTKRDVPKLRQRRVYDVIRRVMAHFLGQRDFRIVHASIQRNHLHLIVEAANERELSSKMAGFAIRCARALNRTFGRKGKLFAFRYKAKQIQTRDYARNAISYVLNNWRRHREDERDQRLAFDPYSSALSFTGWALNKRRHGDVIDRGFPPLPVSQPRTNLLLSAWQWHGLIDPYEKSAGNYPRSAARDCATR